jgi:alpha-tubulin suppressor-like RCC1 family protein
MIMRQIARAWRAAATAGLVVAAASIAGLPAGAVADQASQPGLAAAGRIAAGGDHTCAILSDGSVRCWGYGASGQLGYGNTNSVGDNETPASVGPVNLGPGHTATAIAAGDSHTCAILNDGSVRCWGFGGDGRLGYGTTNNLGDRPATTPGKLLAVNLGAGHTAKSITAGGSHTCAVLDDGSVRCWGFGGDGRLGLATTQNVTDPSSVGPIDLGAGRTARAVSAGEDHTCALLDDGSVLCWGFGGAGAKLGDGRLGYGNTENVGDNETPGSVGPVNLGSGRTAVAISAGGAHTCAILDDGTVKCWGSGISGQLGYGNPDDVGSTPTTTPDTVGPVSLGPGRTAKAISAGLNHTCAVLDDHSVRCWGPGLDGQLGYGSTNNVGDSPASTPNRVGPVKLGVGRTATAISAGAHDTCAVLDNNTVRCWGYGGNGELGYCSQSNIGDTPATTPVKAGWVNLKPGDGGTVCASSVDPVRLQAERARRLAGCESAAARQPKRRRNRARSQCIKLYGRRPGRVRALHARALAPTSVVLVFAAPGSDGRSPPAARTYLVKVSPRPIRSAADFRRAPALCDGRCRFNVTIVGTTIKLRVTHLQPRSTYYYAVAAYDNVSGLIGPRSPTVVAHTR